MTDAARDTAMPAEVGGLVDVTQPLDDPHVGSDGACDWSDIANAIDEVRRLHATALAAKDAEMEGWKRTATEYASELHSLRSQLDEARKALDALDRMNRGLDWCDQDEQARRWSAARRALKAEGRDD